MAPPGTKITLYNKPNQCKSWQYHGTEGWYARPAHDHYWCLTCYLPIIRTVVVSDTVQSNIPGVKLDIAKTALIKLAQILNIDKNTPHMKPPTLANPEIHQHVTSKGERNKIMFKVALMTDAEFEYDIISLNSTLECNLISRQ